MSTYQNDRKVRSTMSNAFVETKNMFRDATGYTAPLTFDQWNAVPRDYKAAVLFVQFFDQITLAWYKVKSFYTEDEDGVSTMLQYLEKNVPIIEKNKARFTAHYIYQVAYNCLYCICHDIERDRKRWQLEMSNITYSSNGDELDLFDTVTEGCEFDSKLEQQAFWALIDTVMTQKVDDKVYEDGEAVAVLNELLGGTAGRRVFRFPGSSCWVFGRDAESRKEPIKDGAGQSVRVQWSIHGVDVESKLVSSATRDKVIAEIRDILKKHGYGA